MELHLANLAETRERVRRRRSYERAEGPPQRESLAEAAERLSGRSSKAAARALDDLRLDLTLTAHPTEATRWSVMEHAGDVSARLAELDDDRLGPAAKARIVDRIRESLALWWQTAEVRRTRPQVDDEVRRNLHYFDRVLYDAVPELVRELERCFGPLPLDIAPVRFSSWAGGDMDGHPGVTAETFTTTVDLHRRVAMRLLIERVEWLASRFSQSDQEMGAGRAALDASLRRDASLMPDVTRRLGERRFHEPERAKLTYISERLLTTGEQPDDELAYRDAAQLRRDVELVRDAAGAGPVAEGAIKDVLRQVSAFGLHLARLDVRLNADAIRESVLRDLPELQGAGAAGRRPHPRRAAGHGRPRPLRPDLPADRGAARGQRRRAPLRRGGRRHAGDLDGPRADRRARRAVARAPRRPGGAGRAAAAHHAAVRDARRARAGSGHDGRPVRRPGLPRAPRAPRRPPGDHARLLRLGQGRRLPHQPVGDLPRAGAARGAGAGARDRGHVLPRPRRVAVARRRAGAPGDPRPAAGHAGGRRADHRAGRGHLGQVRRSGAGRPLARAAGLGAAARPRDAGPAGADRRSGTRSRALLRGHAGCTAR